MSNKRNLQDKVNQVKVVPSTEVWGKIERNLDADHRIHRIRRNSIIGWAAALLVIVLAYQVGKYEIQSPDYQPQTLQLNDQAGENFLPQDFYSLQKPVTAYRKDGQLIPNSQALWKNPLVPRTVDF